MDGRNRRKQIFFLVSEADIRGVLRLLQQFFLADRSYDRRHHFDRDRHHRRIIQHLEDGQVAEAAHNEQAKAIKKTDDADVYALVFYPFAV